MYDWTVLVVFKTVVTTPVFIVCALQDLRMIVVGMGEEESIKVDIST